MRRGRMGASGVQKAFSNKYSQEWRNPESNQKKLKLPSGDWHGFYCISSTMQTNQMNDTLKIVVFVLHTNENLKSLIC